MEVEVVTRPDGCQLVRHLTPLGAYPQSIPHILAERADAHGGRVFLAERDESGGWRTLTFAQAKARSDAVAQALLERGLGQDKPVMILSGNSIEFAILAFAAMTAGAPVAPVSPAYSLLSTDFANLKQIFELVKPALVFARDGERFAGALSALDLKGVEVVSVSDLPGATPFSDLLDMPVGPAVAESMARIGPDTVAKYLFTSGSTGAPKGVINTQRMMCANIAMYDLVGLHVESGVTVDWLPWHHTFGGNANFNMALNRGWTLHLDEGRPIPGQFGESIRNLREISPTTYASVPAAFAMLAEAMENDDELRLNFFRRLIVMFYGGAALPGDVFDRIQKLAVRTTGMRIVMVAGYGSTETAPSMMGSYWLTEQSGLLGLPKPGVELKLVPDGDPPRNTLQGAHHHAGLFEAAGSHARGFRRGRLLYDRRCRALGRSGRSPAGPRVRGPGGGELQAHDRHLGPDRDPARDGPGGGIAAPAGCGRGGAGQGLRRTAGLAEYGGAAVHMPRRRGYDARGPGAAARGGGAYSKGIARAQRGPCRKRGPHRAGSSHAGAAKPRRG